MTLQSLKLITADELGEALGVPKATLYAWRYRGEGPPSLKVGRHLRYRAADVEEWLDTCRGVGASA